MMKRTGVAVLIICMAIACKPTPDIIPLPEMKFVMWDILNADALYTQLALKDSLARQKKLNVQLYQKVFDIHHISRQQFFTSYRYYEANPDKMKILMDSVNAYGTRERSIADSLQELAIKKKAAAAAAAAKPVVDTTKKLSIDSLRKQHIITPIPPPVKTIPIDSLRKVKVNLPQRGMIRNIPGMTTIKH